ncbi:phage tail assembly protein T [Klebsiella sp. PL-2018]|uniref:phage tail assembly protein T n=1 Tax=Klebsiella sp. PL-2018 TaxID=2851540 RepID=UPI001C228154|nr:phage tail assembly protein T [Klebsiella sp. PL-2018]
MKLAREFRRADWRAFLAGMTSTELADWHIFYQSHLFQDALIDTHLSNLQFMTAAASADLSNTSITPQSFSLLNPPEEKPQNEESMMLAAEGIAGGTRYGPAD